MPITATRSRALRVAGAALIAASLTPLVALQGASAAPLTPPADAASTMHIHSECPASLPLLAAYVWNTDTSSWTYRKGVRGAVTITGGNQLSATWTATQTVDFVIAKNNVTNAENLVDLRPDGALAGSVSIADSTMDNIKFCGASTSTSPSPTTTSPSPTTTSPSPTTTSPSPVAALAVIGTAVCHTGVPSVSWQVTGTNLGDTTTGSLTFLDKTGKKVATVALNLASGSANGATTWPGYIPAANANSLPTFPGANVRPVKIQATVGSTLSSPIVSVTYPPACAAPSVSPSVVTSPAHTSPGVTVSPSVVTTSSSPSTLPHTGGSLPIVPLGASLVLLGLGLILFNTSRLADPRRH